MDAPRSPGWYPDPERAGAQRWWNGAGWSDARRGMSGAPSRQAPGASRAPGAVADADADAVVNDADTNGAAFTGLTLAFIGLALMPLALAGLILSIVGLRKARRLRAAGGYPVGRTAASLGIVLGAISVVGTVALAAWIVSTAT